jgi:isopentenyl diphosphate isomerase/L-lactate dehydrogenase-like FMN-dependent dehydrogenase
VSINCPTGGQQFDGGISALYALKMITRLKKIQEAQQSGKFTVFFDSSICTGSDIIKAMALGAQGILCAYPILRHAEEVCLRIMTVGRPWVYGLIIGGQAGVEQVLQMTLSDLYMTLGMARYQNLEEIQGQRDSIIMKLDF